MTDFYESNGEYFDEDQWRRATEHIYEGYDSDGYDSDGYNADGFDREGKDKYGNEFISDTRQRILEARYEPVEVKCANCHEVLSEWWREIREDYCADCLRKGYTLPRKLP